jgi:hypothetical protein
MRRAKGVAPTPPTHAVVQPVPPHRPAHRVASWHQLVRLGLPTIVGLLLLAFHLSGFALLNLEAARLKWLDKESRRLQQQNEQLKAYLDTLTSEPAIRRWAEAQGMVRAENQNAWLLPIATPSGITAASPSYGEPQVDTRMRIEQAGRGSNKRNPEILQNLNQRRR